MVASFEVLCADNDVCRVSGPRDLLHDYTLGDIVRVYTEEH